MLIENSLSDAVRFFHMNALSSAVGLKVDFDMAVLVVASGLYRLLAGKMLAMLMLTHVRYLGILWTCPQVLPFPKRASRLISTGVRISQSFLRPAFWTTPFRFPGGMAKVSD